MPVFQVSSRSVKSAGPPRKRPSRTMRQVYAVLRYVQAVGLVGGTFVLVLLLVQTRLVFILLPAGASVVTGVILGRTKLGQPKVLILTIVVTTLYFAGVTGFELATHNSSTLEIIVVTTTLTIAVILEPVRTFVQTFFEQRYHLREDAASRAIVAFSTALREEIDLDAVRERFLDVAQQTMGPQSVAVWVRVAALDGADGEQALAEYVAHDGQSVSVPPGRAVSAPATSTTEVELADDDPFLAYLLAHLGILELDRLQLDSPALKILRAGGVELVLALASEGELLGLLALGPRLAGAQRLVPIPGTVLFGLLGVIIPALNLSALDYTREDRDLLDTLASQLAPAVRVAQLVRARQAQVREHERIEQELRTAQQIQRTFLPKDIPAPPGWRLVPYYQPAREVGGDFYDFHVFEDGRLGIVLGDVTGKGIPAALVMTAARTMLRTAAQQQPAPGEVFARVNDLLCTDIPTGMFVTCFYALLEPTSGRLRFANAGQDLPYLRHEDGSIGELHATGMPLGLMPGTSYDEGTALLAPGDSLLFYSDGLVEAHNPRREMFGLRRLARLVEQRPGDQTLIAALLRELQAFTGAGWEQEDDVTLVAVQRLRQVEGGGLQMSQAKNDNHEADETSKASAGPDGEPSSGAPELHTLGEWRLASVPGNERQAIQLVEAAVRRLALQPARLERLKTAVGEATMNAIEHGNRYQPDLPVVIQALASPRAVVVRIGDEGGAFSLAETPTPDLEAKLAGLQSPRGWGLFLIEHLVDEVHVTSDETRRTIELVMRLDAADAGNVPPADASGGQ
jgi:serine phosphatase RsbU (regulator of sigma subunit)/anti-sigma regulatory factor (Ser/Thr protein kinase)